MLPALTCVSCFHYQKEMKALILGCGYVGKELAERLIQDPEKKNVVWATSRTPDKLDVPELAGAHRARVDLTDPNPFGELPDTDWDLVFQSISSGRGGADVYRAVYLEGVRKTRDWLKNRASGIGAWIYTSSTSVYGQQDGSWVDETSPTLPHSETSEVLIETEQELFDACKQDQLPVQVLRLSGIYGPGRGFLFQQFLKGEAKMSQGDSRFLNMVHRDDVVGATLHLTQYGKSGEVYNVSDRQPVTRQAFLEWLADRLGRERAPFVDQDEGALNRKRGVTNKRVSSDKLTHQAGYSFIFPDYVTGFEDEMHRNGLL